MTRALALVRAEALRAQTRCPVCGARRIEAINMPRSPIVICSYDCSAVFQVDANGAIIPAITCPAPSQVAAGTLNAETLDAARGKAGAA